MAALRTCLCAGLLLGGRQVAGQVNPETALAEGVFLRTILEQGGGSHASGQRPELGPTHAALVVSRDPAAIRVGLTPSAFLDSGGLRLEYDTAAAHNHDRVDLTADGPFEVVDGSGAVVGRGSAGENFDFARRAGGVALGGPAGPMGWFPGPLRVRPADGSLLVVNSMRRINRLAPIVAGSFQLTPPPYRGELEVFPSEADPARLRLVNVVALEEYVPGVVVNESLSTFHVEALKAQAVAARGYALANLGRFASRGFDIDDSTLSQVYRGQSSETAVALGAAASTLGLVATRPDGRILSALYSSSMGGHTEDNEYVFPAGGYPGTNADPSLRAIHDAADRLGADLSTDGGALSFYSTTSCGSYEVNAATCAPITSLHRWTRTRSAAELLARLKDPSRGWGVPASASAISDIRTTLRGSSGRTMQVAITGDWGATTISGWSDLRALASLAGVTPGGTGEQSAPNSPSTFVLTRDAAGRVAQVLFYGGGFGHNVGMSQYGANGRALRGQDFSQILSGYYTGMQLGTVPFLLRAGAAGPSLGFVAGSSLATLRVENAGLAGLLLELNGRRLELVPDRRGTVEADLTGYLRPGVNRLRYEPRGSRGEALVLVRLEPERSEDRPRRR